jgi:cation:H+ antiporter
VGSGVEAALWLGALAAALYASEKLVHHVSDVGRHVGLSAAELGLLVALGADAPEISSSLIAVVKGASDVGLGIIIGSNVYNIAGLLGLSAVLAGRVPTGPGWITREGITNIVLSGLLLVLVIRPVAHIAIGIVLLIVLAAYAVLTATRRAPAGESTNENSEQDRSAVPQKRRPLVLSIVYLAMSVAFILGASYLLVSESLALGKTLAIPSAILGTFVLAIATSLPNTWAAVSLARRGMPAAAIATTFTSNSINMAIGGGLPSIFLKFHISAATRELDVPWLFVMTGAALVLLATRHVLSRLEGSVLIALYAAFVIIRIVAF